MLVRSWPLRQRGRRSRSGERIEKLVDEWLPKTHILHPWRAQRLPHGAPHHPREVDPLVVNRDDIVQRTRCSLGPQLLLADLVAFSHLHFSQIRGRQPYLNVRKNLYVIGRVASACQAQRRRTRAEGSVPFSFAIIGAA